MPTDTVLLGIAAAANPLVVLGFLLAIRWLDRYEREPLGVTLAMFGLGAFGAPLVTLALHTLLQPVLEPVIISAEWFTAVVSAPLIEEFAKGAMFLPMILTGFWGTSRFNLARHIDNSTDGLIYGAAIGLGFGAAENLLYFLHFAELTSHTAFLSDEFVYESFTRLLVHRTVTCVFVHATSTALVGWAVGYARHRRGRHRWLIYPGHAWVLAVVNHSLWNQMAAGGEWTLELGLVHTGVAAALLFAITQVSLWREHRILREYLVSEAARGTLPLAHARIIPYWRRRLSRGWLDEQISKAEYVRAATLLAFRLHQWDLAGDDHDYATQRDIAELRERVEALRAGAVREDAG